jgi:hypothetical protein
MSGNNDPRLPSELLEETKQCIRDVWRHQCKFAERMEALDQLERSEKPKKPKVKNLSRFLTGQYSDRRFIRLVIRTLRTAIPSSASPDNRKIVLRLSDKLEHALNAARLGRTGNSAVLAGLAPLDSLVQVVQTEASEKTHFRSVVEHTGYECCDAISRPSVQCIPFEVPPTATPQQDAYLERNPQPAGENDCSAPLSDTLSIGKDPSSFTFGDAVFCSCIAGCVASLLAHACGEPDSTHAGRDAMYLQIVQGCTAAFITYRTFQSMKTPPQNALRRSILISACVLSWIAYFYLGVRSGEPIGLTLRDLVLLPFPSVGSFANAISTLVHTTLFCVLAVFPAYVIAYGPVSRVVAKP